jgi:glycine dehydrogenase subunit 2
MKYNPKACERVASLDGFAGIHPLQPESTVQGALQVMHELEKMLCRICGFERFSLQPAAGAHGELTGIMIAKAYFRDKGEDRAKVLVPDSAHGTNPASVSMCGFEAVEVKSDKKGNIDLADLKGKMDESVAALMITNPNTLGFFDQNILEICRIVHEKGGLVYGDGANMNALLGVCRPADLGIDIMHLNLHKTFATPHGGGGPGSGPVGVVEKLVGFLPRPLVEKKGQAYRLDFGGKKSIGKVRSFYGNFGVMVKACTYLKGLGEEGLKKVAEGAVLNANYLKERLKGSYELPFDRQCMHEFVLSDKGLPNGVTTNDVAKRLMDYGFHPPTVYFPLIVHGAMMIEPTETESKETLDAFADALLKIREEAEKEPELVKTAPHSTPVKRLDAVKAAREPDLRWKPGK